MLRIVCFACSNANIPSFKVSVQTKSLSQRFLFDTIRNPHNFPHNLNKSSQFTIVLYLSLFIFCHCFLNQPFGNICINSFKIRIFQSFPPDGFFNSVVIVWKSWSEHPGTHSSQMQSWQSILWNHVQMSTELKLVQNCSWHARTAVIRLCVLSLTGAMFSSHFSFARQLNHSFAIRHTFDSYVILNHQLENDFTSSIPVEEYQSKYALT